MERFIQALDGVIAAIKELSDAWEVIADDTELSENCPWDETDVAFIARLIECRERLRNINKLS